MLHILASMIAWVSGIAITLSLIWLLVLLLRAILRRSHGNPRLRVLLLIAAALGLFMLWSASQIVP